MARTGSCHSLIFYGEWQEPVLAILKRSQEWQEMVLATFLFDMWQELVLAIFKVARIGSCHLKMARTGSCHID